MVGLADEPAKTSVLTSGFGGAGVGVGGAALANVFVTTRGVGVGTEGWGNGFGGSIFASTGGGSTSAGGVGCGNGLGNRGATTCGTFGFGGGVKVGAINSTDSRAAGRTSIGVYIASRVRTAMITNCAMNPTVKDLRREGPDSNCKRLKESDLLGLLSLPDEFWGTILRVNDMHHQRAWETCTSRTINLSDSRPHLRRHRNGQKVFDAQAEKQTGAKLISGLLTL